MTLHETTFNKSDIWHIYYVLIRTSPRGTPWACEQQDKQKKENSRLCLDRPQLHRRGLKQRNPNR